MKTIKVKDCIDCPYCEANSNAGYEYYCDHPQLTFIENVFKIEDVIHIPDWCPLKKESIKIELK